MDVSFTNVLEGARQYFQGLPVPSTGAATTSADHNLAPSSTSSGSSTSAAHDHGTATSVAPPPPAAPPPQTTAASSADQEASRYPTEVRPASVESGAASSSGFWNPPVEPYPPQPTRVEVPDTRPGDEGSGLEPTSSSSVTLTEMQPSGHRSNPQKQSSAERHPATASNSPRLHQMQPPQQPHSPGPVYQQLNNVTRTSFSTAEMLATSHQPTYQTASDRQSQAATPVVAQRTQYYPRYHHPDITKSAPVPFSQSSIYQSANVAPTSSGNVPQTSTRPTPVEQSNVGHSQQEQRVPSSYGPVGQCQNSGSAAYASSTSPNYRPVGQHQQGSRANPVERPLHNSEGSHSSCPSSSPSCSTSPHVSGLHNPHASSPHHAPSPHSGFQPHSPTYPPPARSTPHSYSLPSTSQHYQSSPGYAGNPYGLPPQSSYHSFQKSPQQGSYYPPRSHGQSYVQQMPMPVPSQSICSGTPSSNGPVYQHSKPVTYNGAEAKRTAMDVPSYASYRSSLPPRTSNTHNLPPIAALSSYHSNRRESAGKAVQRQRVHPTTVASKISAAVPPASSMVPPQRIPEYSMGTMNHAMPLNGRTTTVANSSYGGRYASQQQQNYTTYATTMAPSHHGSSSSSSTTVTSIGATARSSVPAATVHAAYQSSESTSRRGPTYLHHTGRTGEEYAYKEYAYQNSSLSSAQQAPAATIPVPSQQTNGVRKRESPLDLSVKTVKTSADSTAQDDLEASSMDKHVSSSSLVSSRSNGSRTMVPMQPPQQAASYVTFDARPSSNGTRNPTATCVRTSTPQTVCAPKVDFLPDFNSAPLRHHPVQPHENALRRSSAQQLYAPPPQSLPSQHPNSTGPLPHMSTFKKTPLPATPVYDGAAPPPLPPPAPTSSYPQVNDASRSSKYPPPVVDPTRIGPGAIPVQNYPSEATKYYRDARGKYEVPSSRDRLPQKRPAEAVYTAGGPSKHPRVDTWRVAIDKQIQQRLSTARALHEQQKRQEMNLPVPLPNGTLVAPANYEQRSDSGYSSSESSRYQQPYCDKRSYPEPKVAHSSPAYSHPIVSKPSSVHPLPQQLSGGQSTYPAYRQSQKMPCPPSGNPSGQQVDPPSNTGADKRVLSLLRNSLENKQQREEQLHSQQPILANHSQQSFQNKVVAPVEPKTNIGRHNLSPFTAASLLERNSNTPPHYKFHVPRAVDSITQEAPRSLYGSRVNSSATLPGKEALLGPRGAENQIHRDKDDGLAAILAAKIRTKAELKQVGTGQFTTKATTVPSQDASSTPKELDSAASTSTPQSGSSAGSPPKLTREKVACLPPRRRLFSKTEEENMPVAATVPVPVPAPTVASTVPPRASGFRSSSETSVFDFRESDSEGEMPVLERQTLEEMRRDRKQLSKVQPPVPLNDAMCMGMGSSTDLVKIELKENDKINEVDPFWSATCDKFMEQLRTGDSAKKRGRKKKVNSSTATSKLEEAGNESDKDSDESVSPLKIRPEDIKCELNESERESKEEPPETSKEEPAEMKAEAKPEIKREEEKELSDDSDEVPLIRRANKKAKKEDSDCEEEVICRKRRVRRGSRIKLESSSGSESSSEESDASTEFGHGSSVADRLRARKRSANNGTEAEGMKLRSRDTTPHKAKPESRCSTSKTAPKPKPKPLFGDGSDFRPGWEEEVYVYKKSLRMPPRLITVSKPSRFHRLSTSLPDLDPGSPALSVSMDSADVCLGRKRIIDSDMESNCSFSITGLGSKIDDEEATSSTTISCPPKATKHSRAENNSIVDVLAQKVGTSKKEQRKRQREKSERAGKLLQKGSNEPELLPTPSLAPLIPSDATKSPKGKTPVKNHKALKPIKVTDSYLLGYFRKETVNNFRDTFRNNHALPNEFSTLVLKSRTRTETRVLKKQATIREVFGEDRPASAPPMQNHDDTSQDDDSQTETPENTLGKVRSLRQRVVSRLRNAGILRSHKAILNSKRHLLIAKRRKDLLKSLAEKKLQRIKTEVEEDATQEETNDGQEAENNELDDDNNESEVRNKKKLKLRTSRRKFRSGFDYIRKKKKPLKKDEGLPKERKRQVLSRPSPECVADIQSEIRTWVIKKGVGETILHRAARLGYTDVTAYCLEKLNSAPSPKDNAGYTPLHEACSRGHLEIAKLLLAYGANASESANGGIRPLHEAAENGATELVRLLLSYGADPLLATYSGQTPLMLALDTEAYSILEQHLDDIQGRTSTPWSFGGPASIFDPEETGYNPLDNPPLDSPKPELDEVEMEVSDVNLPVLFSLANDPDKWVLLQDLMAALRIKSRDALLRQVNPKAHSGPPAIVHRDVMRELKLPDFLEQSRCSHILSGGERINVRASKVTLIKYNEKVKSLLNVEKVLISLR
ncbi:hypothetical protein KM043_009702 [Ampulex compressa]|nr:hypothetical protein KM043_009702 [Ampulex compressa]